MRDQVMHFKSARVYRAQRGWLVRIQAADGAVFEYRYPTRRAARYFAAIFRLEPTWFPPPHAVVPPAPAPVAEVTPETTDTLDIGASEFLAAVDAAFSEAL